MDQNLLKYLIKSVIIAIHLLAWGQLQTQKLVETIKTTEKVAKFARILKVFCDMFNYFSCSNAHNITKLKYKIFQDFPRLPTKKFNFETVVL